MNVHVTVSVDPKRLEDFDVWWRTEGFKSRSEALAYLMVNVKPSAPKAELVEANDPW